MKKLGHSSKRSSKVDSVKSGYDKKVRNEILDTAHLNYMGEVSYDIHCPVHQLKVASSSCFFGEPSYYDKNERVKDGVEKKLKRTTAVYNDIPSKSLDALFPFLNNNVDLGNMNYMEALIDKALEKDPVATLEWACELRNEFNIRLTPQVIMVRAANHYVIRELTKKNKKSLISEYVGRIIKRSDEPAAQLTYQLNAFGKPIPNVLKREWAKYLEKQDDYSIAKYRNNTGTPYKLVDVVNVSHPKSETINKLMNGSLVLGGDNETWESLISREGSTKENWTKAVDLMGHMALLRNLRNLLMNDVNPDLYLKKLVDGVKGGKQLPFRYYSAYVMISDLDNENRQKVLDALEDCMELAIDNVPKLSGRIASLADNSGSAQNYLSSMGKTRISEIGNLMAIVTGYVNQDNKTNAFVFGDKLKSMPVSQRNGILTQAKQLNELGETVGGGTENGVWIFLNDILKNKVHYDHVFIYSDMQAGHGGLYGTNPSKYSNYIVKRSHIDVPKLIKEYHKKVNPNCKFYLVQIAGYTDTIVPEFYKNVYILGGWSEAIFNFANQMTKLD